jgi:heterodisulfide reductase subunit C
VKDWGYSILKGRQIDFENNDFSISKFVAQHEPSFKWCIGCGSCTATCSAARFTDFNPRKINLLIQRGETKDLAEEIAKCMLCGKCQLVCPRGINTRNVIQNIKRALITCHAL